MATPMIYAKFTDARFLAFPKDSTKLPLPFDTNEGDEYPTVAKVNEDTKGKFDIVRIEERKKYYYLPIDQYNQPNGFIEEIELFPCDYEGLRTAKGIIVYIFDNYRDACRRAED